MPAYIVYRASIHDMDAYGEYMKRTPAAIAKYDGKFIARGGKVTVLEGEPEPRRVVLLEFPSREQAEQFYRSTEYQEAKTYREGIAEAQMLVVDDLPDSAVEG
ncbi:MAG: DUF1330 domain-containing protein [Pseudomonadota bacterium]